MANYHVTHSHNGNGNGWKVQRAGAQRASRIVDTQAEAIARANTLARKSGGGEVNIHRKDNAQIRGKNTINKADPYPPRG